MATTLAKINIKDNSAWNTYLDLIYPVGSYYISNTSTSPSSRFGGSWSQVTGRYPLFFSSNSTGGNYNISIDHLPAHSHPQIRYDPNNYSTTVDRTVAAFHHTGSSYAYGWYSSGLQVGYSDAANLSWSDGSSGSYVGGGRTYYPAYQGVYAWYRTA